MSSAPADSATDVSDNPWPVRTARVLERRLKIYSRSSALLQVANATELSEYEVTVAAEKGAVWQQKAGHNKGMAKPRRVRVLDEKVVPGTVVYINYNSEILLQVPPVPLLVSDQGNYSVWEKPAGMLSQGSKWSDHCTLTRVVEKAHGKPAFLVHRLDRAAAGLMLVAHTRNALAKLTEMFANRAVEKFYRTTVCGNFDQHLPHVLDAPIGGKAALTQVHSAQYDEATDTSALEVQITTGRKHQIRQHLADAGYPVQGDRLFAPDTFHEVDLQLRATKLAFECPFAKIPLNFSSPN